jgi:hypothetical protein
MSYLNYSVKLTEEMTMHKGKKHKSKKGGKRGGKKGGKKGGRRG